jgi:hypothetical protein
MFTLKDALIRPPIPPKAKSTIAEHLRGDRGIGPRELREPAEPSPAAARSSGRLERGGDVEEREQARKEDREGQEGVQELPGLVDARIRVLVMDADRRGQDQEQDERGPRHRIAEELAAGLARHQRVPRDVRGQEPEVDDRVAGEPEERPRQERVGSADEPERPRDEEQEHLGGQAHRRERPHREGDERHERRQGRPLPWIPRLPPAPCEHEFKVTSHVPTTTSVSPT